MNKRILTVFLALLLTLALVPAAVAESPAAIFEQPTDPDYVIRIDGGYVKDHLETVNDAECLRVDLFLEGVTNERLLSSISFKLAYDPEQITHVKNKPLSGSGNMCMVNANDPGLIQYAFISTNGILLDGATPILTMWFEVANGLADGAKIEFAFTEPIKSDSVSAGSYHSEKRTVGADLHPYIVTAETLYGDANCDGSVTAADAALILHALTGLDTLSDQGMKNAKVDGTDTLNTEDAALILRFVVRLIARFPVQD